MLGPGSCPAEYGKHGALMNKEFWSMQVLPNRMLLIQLVCKHACLLAVRTCIVYNLQECLLAVRTCIVYNLQEQLYDTRCQLWT